MDNGSEGSSELNNFHGRHMCITIYKSVFGDNRNKRIIVKEELIKPGNEIVEKINRFFPSIIKNLDNLIYKNFYPIFAIIKDKILKQFQLPTILAIAIKCKNKMFRFKEIMT